MIAKGFGNFGVSGFASVFPFALFTFLCAVVRTLQKCLGRAKIFQCLSCVCWTLHVLRRKHHLSGNGGHSLADPRNGTKWLPNFQILKSDALNSSQ